MNCPNCNTPLNDGDIFCIACGQKVAQQQAPQNAAPASNGPAYNAQPQYTAPNAQAQYTAPNNNIYSDPSSYAVKAEPEQKVSPIDAVKNLFTTVTTNISTFINSNEKLRKIVFKEDGKINIIVPAAAGGVVVVLLVLIIAIASSGGSAKSVAKDYLKALNEENLYTVIENEVIDHDAIKGLLKDLAKEEDLTEKEMYERIAKEIDESDAAFTNYKGFAKYVSEKAEEEEKDWLEDTYGDDYKIKVEVESPEKCTKSRSEDYRDSLDALIRNIEDSTDVDLGFDADDAKKFVEVDYTVVIEGSEDRDKDRDTLILVKIKGDWKVMDFNGDELFDLVDLY